MEIIFKNRESTSTIKEDRERETDVKAEKKDSKNYFLSNAYFINRE